MSTFEENKAAYLSVGQVALRLQVCERTVRNLLQSGKLPGVRIGRQWRVEVCTLEEYLAGFVSPLKSVKNDVESSESNVI
jgi:excisionase family DNA binding protein